MILKIKLMCFYHDRLLGVNPSQDGHHSQPNTENTKLATPQFKRYGVLTWCGKDILQASTCDHTSFTRMTKSATSPSLRFVLNCVEKQLICIPSKY